MEIDLKYRMELKIELESLEKRRDDMLEQLDKLPLEQKAMHDFWRDYSLLGYRIEVIEQKLKPKPSPPLHTRRDNVHQMIFRNGKEKPNGA